VPPTDNFFAALNSAVFTDGTFVYVPKGVRCPMELSTYFRINARNTGQFERTLIVADEGSYVSYLEGCTAPQRDENQLHAAVVELVALEDAEIKYSTVQNWYPGDERASGGIYNFVTKRGDCRGALEDLLDPGRDRLGHHLEVPELHPARRRLGRRVLLGRRDQGPPAGRHRHQDDPLGKNTRSHHRLQGHLRRRGPEHLPRAGAHARGADNARNHTQCDSLLIGRLRRPHLPVHRGQEPSAKMEHEATTSKISEDQLFYCRSARLSEEDAVSMIVNGFCKEVFNELPMEFAVEAQKLLSISLEGQRRLTAAATPPRPENAAISATNHRRETQWS
jgi:Fe-S cluster assembly protein SufB